MASKIKIKDLKKSKKLTYLRNEIFYLRKENFGILLFVLFWV